MANFVTLFILWLTVICTFNYVKLMAHGARGESTRFYDFKVLSLFHFDLHICRKIISIYLWFSKFKSNINYC